MPLQFDKTHKIVSDNTNWHVQGFIMQLALPTTAVGVSRSLSLLELSPLLAKMYL